MFLQFLIKRIWNGITSVVWLKTSTSMVLDVTNWHKLNICEAESNKGNIQRRRELNF